MLSLAVELRAMDGPSAPQALFPHEASRAVSNKTVSEGHKYTVNFKARRKHEIAAAPHDFHSGDQGYERIPGVWPHPP
jgi:hypothetical protein